MFEDRFQINRTITVNRVSEISLQEFKHTEREDDNVLCLNSVLLLFSQLSRFGIFMQSFRQNLMLTVSISQLPTEVCPNTQML